MQFASFDQPLVERIGGQLVFLGYDASAARRADEIIELRVKLKPEESPAQLLECVLAFFIPDPTSK